MNFQSRLGVLVLSLSLLVGCGEEGTTDTAAKKATEDTKATVTDVKDKSVESLSKAAEEAKEE